MTRSTTPTVPAAAGTGPVTTVPVPAVPAVPVGPAPAARVRPVRRAAVLGAGLAACVLPVSFGTSAVVMLATGVEADHRFHQVTGQGVLLAAVWLGGLLPLVAAGLRGRRPSTATGLHSLAFGLATVLAAALAPGNGGAAVAGITVVTGALLWAALPRRPRLRGAFAGGLDPLLAPVALLTAALVTPFALDQADLQHAFLDEHAEMSHYFDMAWVVLALAGLAACAAVSAAARSLSTWASAGLLVTGASRWLITGETTWSASAVALGAVGLVLAGVRASSPRTAT